MNGSQQETDVLLAGIIKGIDSGIRASCDLAVLPPSVYVKYVRGLCKTQDIAVGVQDCSFHTSGAFTGEISPVMAVDCGATYALAGHSERRQYHRETDEIVAKKADAAQKAGLIAIVCVGETDQERHAGAEKDVVARQIKHSLPAGATSENTVIAYEPVWAIGTGKTATPEDVRVMHSFIREILAQFIVNSEKVRILYGGSMKPENAAELLAVRNVDGGLIGGASLKADQFLAIARAAVKN